MKRGIREWREVRESAWKERGTCETDIFTLAIRLGWDVCRSSTTRRTRSGIFVFFVVKSLVWRRGVVGVVRHGPGRGALGGDVNRFTSRFSEIQ